MADKIFINGAFINEFVFQSGGSILKVSIPLDRVDEFAYQLKANARDGWVRLQISRNRNPKVSAKTGKPISTHSLSVDDWKPNQGQQTPPRASSARQEASQQSPEPDDDGGRVPF